MGTDYRSDVGLAALDVDGDGWVDLVCSGVWYRNPGKPREAAFERIPFAEEAAARTTSWSPTSMATTVRTS